MLKAAECKNAICSPFSLLSDIVGLDFVVGLLCFLCYLLKQLIDIPLDMICTTLRHGRYRVKFKPNDKLLANNLSVYFDHTVFAVYDWLPRPVFVLHR